MRKLLIHFIIFLSLILGSSSLSSQDIKFENIGIKEGLPFSSIFDVIQDKYGFIWIATINGLYRYDGQEYEKFIYDSQDSTSFENSNTRGFFQEENGNIWITTSRGLSYYDYFSDSFKKVLDHDQQNRYWAIFQDGQDIYISRTKELIKYNLESHTSELVFQGKEFTETGRVFCFQKTPEGNFILGTWERGVYLIDPEGEILNHFQHDPERYHSLTNNTIIRLIKGKDHQYWIATNGGLNLLDLSTGKLTTHLTNNMVYSLFFDDQTGKLWVGTTSNGLYIIDTKDNKIRNYKFDVDDPFSLANNHVNKIFKDRTGIIWLGTWIGISKVNPKWQAFRSLQIKGELKDSMKFYTVAKVFETKDRTIWGNSFDYGICYFDTLSQSLKPYPVQPDKIDIYPRGSFEEDEKGNLIIGTAGGKTPFYILNRISQKIYPAESAPSFTLKDTSISNFTMAIHKDSRKNLWIGADYNEGVTKINGHQVTHYVPDSINTQYPAGAWDITEDPAGNIWFMCYLNFWKYDPQKDHFIKYNLEKDSPQANRIARLESIDVDSSGIVWLGSMGAGLLRFDPKTNEYRYFGEKEGLISDIIWALTLDDLGNVWISTTVGLSKFNTHLETIENYNSKNGLSSRYSQFSKYKSRKSGNIYFGGGKGRIDVIQPHKIIIDSIPPQVALTKLRIDNKKVPVQRENQPENTFSLKSTLNLLSNLVLSYSQNDISIEYVGLHFSSPEKIQYAYRLKGLNEEWRYVQNQRIANYPNLDPGGYTFEVKAGNADGVWSEPKSIQIRVLPPWWRTWWAYTMYTLIILGSLYAYIQSLRTKVAREIAYNTELQALNEANQRFVPQDFLQILGKESIKELHLGDQTQTKMTILFSDIRSYTSLSETMSPDDNFKFINGYLGRVGPIIKKHGGFIGQYFGDGFMALFLDNHQAAINTAIEIQQVLDEYNQQRKSRGRQTIDTGIGLNTGELMLGIIGDENRYDSTVISDAVNTASRMEGLTKIFGAAIIISEKTLKEFSASNFAHRYLGKVRVKGKDEAVNIYDLYEGEPVSIRQLKAKTQVNFEQGLTHYYKKEFGKAAERFKSVLEMNEKDKAAKYYLDKSVDYIVNDVPDDWSGVEDMVIK